MTTAGIGKFEVESMAHLTNEERLALAVALLLDALCALALQLLMSRENWALRRALSIALQKMAKHAGKILAHLTLMEMWPRLSWLNSKALKEKLFDWISSKAGEVIAG